MSAPSAEVLRTYVQAAPGGGKAMAFMVEGVRCAGCIATLERALHGVRGVTSARLNFSTRRLALEWQGEEKVVAAAMAAAEKAGYGLVPYEPKSMERAVSAQERWLLRCLAVAGFASMNVMLFSVSMWAGPDMVLGQKLLMQWFSAVITLPAVAYAGQPYFRSAFTALRHGRTNMDVPISIALTLTTALSLFDTVAGHGETYFESAVMLLFFLLTGRYLEARVRGRSLNAAEHLMSLQQTHVAVMDARGGLAMVKSTEVPLGSRILWRAGERLGVDGVVTEGEGSVDTSVLTGESLPRVIAKGQVVQAGMVNRGNAICVRTTAVGGGTVLAEIARLVETATSTKNSYTRLADRVARYYAPLVHTLAAATFAFWMLNGLGWHDSLLRAAAVLIVTCPCALALAVPAVQVAVVGKLMRRGVLLKSGDALERLAQVDRVIMDKTGTLTAGRLRVVGGGNGAQRLLAARMAVMSRHPLADGLVNGMGIVKPLAGVKEVAGKGLEVLYRGARLRLGSRAFCGVRKEAPELEPDQAEVWFCERGKPAVRFVLQDSLRPDAAAAVAEMAKLGLRPMLLSGDRPEAVRAIAGRVGLGDFRGGVSPQQKQRVLEEMMAKGRLPMMVGDGLNDAPSLALAPVGISFGRATDLAKLSADVILQQESLMAIPALWREAAVARRAVRFNFGISFTYNLFSVPLAMGGLINPLWAALLMSTSSLIVVVNAARLNRG